MLEFPVKSILYTSKVRAAGHIYDDRPQKLGGEKRLVTMDFRKSRMFISDGLAYLTVRCPTYEEME